MAMSKAKLISIVLLAAAGANSAVSGVPQSFTGGAVARAAVDANLAPPSGATDVEAAHWLAGKITEAAEAATRAIIASYAGGSQAAEIRAALLDPFGPAGASFKLLSSTEQDAKVEAAVNAQMQAAIASAVADAIANTISQAGVSPEIAQLAMVEVDGSLANSILAVIQVGAPQILADGGAAMQSLLSASISEVGGVVQQVALAARQRNVNTTSIGGSDVAGAPPTTVIVIYRG
ncbi:hypothetical protein BH10PSE1_BH10PSE1_26110 [soil metagenome]